MKKNLKVNLIWFGLIIGLFLILKGHEPLLHPNLNGNWDLNPYGTWY